MPKSRNLLEIQQENVLYYLLLYTLFIRISLCLFTLFAIISIKMTTTLKEFLGSAAAAAANPVLEISHLNCAKAREEIPLV